MVPFNRVINLEYIYFCSVLKTSDFSFSFYFSIRSYDISSATRALILLLPQPFVQQILKFKVQKIIIKKKNQNYHCSAFAGDTQPQNILRSMFLLAVMAVAVLKIQLKRMSYIPN